MNKILNYFNQFITLFIAIVLITACNPTVVSLIPTNSPLPSPTLTITPSSTQTMTPQNTDVPNHYDQYENFGDGFVARILIRDTNNLSREEIVIKLVNLLLEHYKTNSLAPRMTIEDYKEVHVIKFIKDNNNYDGFFTIVAYVQFSIIPADVPIANDWMSLSANVSPINSWWLIGSVFGVFRDGEYYRLRITPGWGT